MSAPTPAAPTDASAAPKSGGKKKLLVIGLVVLLLAGAGGGGALWWSKKKAAERAAAEAESEDGAGEHADAKKAQRQGPPVFVVLDPFTVNLADKDAERYAQVGITLEVDDAKVGDQIKQFMPAVRNNILLVLADKTAGELHAREGKQRLADEVLRETSRAIGVETPAPAASAVHKAQPAAEQPLRAVHFSNFIIQ